MNPTTAHSSYSPIQSTKMSPVTRKSIVIAIALCVSVTNAYEHVGCFLDSEDNRLMETSVFESPMVDIGMCAQQCALRSSDYNDYNFFGVQKSFGIDNAKVCWCATEFDGSVEPGFCDMECSEDSEQTCGSSSDLSMDVYELEPIVEELPVDEEPVEETGYDHIGCFQDSLSNRLMEFSTGSPLFLSMSIDMCSIMCLDSEFNFFGLQYGNQCWCTDEFVSDDANPGVCDMECSGDESEICGGNLSMDVYELVPIVEEPVEEPGYDHIGCFQDSLGNRLMEFIIGGSTTDIETCSNICLGYRYEFFGLQYGNQCWCADEFVGDDVNHGVCYMECSGDASEICGGNLSMDVYKFVV